jgi:hypothetical protein
VSRCALAINPEKLNQFIGKFVGDLGAAIQGPSILIGEQLGLYRALAAGGPLRPEGLAEKTGIPERYTRERLPSQAASGDPNRHESRPDDSTTGEHSPSQPLGGSNQFAFHERIELSKKS